MSRTCLPQILIVEDAVSIYVSRFKEEGGDGFERFLAASTASTELVDLVQKNSMLAGCFKLAAQFFKPA